MTEAIPSVLLACNARDEDNIKEWVIYHRLKGFQHIVIFDHQSKIPITSILNQTYPGVVVVDIQDEFIVKMDLMNRAVNHCITTTASTFCSISTPTSSFTRKNSLRYSISCNHCPITIIFAINWLMFGSNFHDHTPKGLLLESYTRSDSHLHKCIKSLVRASEVASCNHPHFFHMKLSPENVRTSVLQHDFLSEGSGQFKKRVLGLLKVLISFRLRLLIRSLLTSSLKPTTAMSHERCVCLR